MAIAVCSVQVISRAKGRSSVAAAAYRSGETLYNEREGVTYSYARKTDRVYSEILAPQNAPEWAKDREQLWNEVEQIEKRKDSQLAREVMIALPKELSQGQNIALARAYAQTFANEGMVADLCIHISGDGNPHAHIMLTTRPFLPDGTWGAKSKEALLLDADGQHIRLKNGNYHSRKIPTTDWNTPEKLLEWRNRYEDITNAHLEKAGSSTRITVKSYEAQGIDKTPTVHMGHFAHALEQQGVHTKVGDINRQIRSENQEREHLKQQLDATLSAIEQEQKRLEQAKQLEAEKREEALRHEAINRRTLTEEEAQKMFDEWVRQAREALTGTSSQKQQERDEWEALKQEAAWHPEASKREDVMRKKSITEEEASAQFAEWVRQAREARNQPMGQPEREGWEALKREAAKREEAWEREEQARREAEARRTFDEHQRRKFVKPSPDLRPFRLARPKRRHGVDWNTIASALRSRQEGHLDWQQLANLAETRRIDWQKEAEQQAGRIDWKQLRDEAEAQRVDWQKLAKQQETGRTDWQELVEEARRYREEPKPSGGRTGFQKEGRKKPLRDLYTTEDESYTSEHQQERDDEDKRK